MHCVQKSMSGQVKTLKVESVTTSEKSLPPLGPALLSLSLSLSPSLSQSACQLLHSIASPTSPWPLAVSDLQSFFLA